MSLKGKSAIVTGSTSGIGQAIAEALAAEGCNVMLNGFGDQAAIARLCEEIARKNGVKVDYNGADMSKPAQIADLVAKTQASFGSVESSSPRRSRISLPKSGTPSSPSISALRFTLSITHCR
jgi:3-hydroxybutyrate dehydrogenase